MTFLNRFFKPFLVLVFFAAIQVGTLQASTRDSAVSKSDTLRLLLIGNSFSMNASQFLPDLAKEGKHPLVIGRAEIGSCSLKKHWDLAQLAEKDPNDPNGKPYKGKSLRTVLSEAHWTVVTLQQYSLHSGCLETYSPYARNLYNFIKSIRPDAQVVIHQTWAYRSDSKDFSLVTGTQSAKSAEEMYQKLHEAYYLTASDLGVKVMPVGDAFQKVSTSKKWGFKPDTQYDFSHPVYPKLPNQTNTLHRGYYWEKDYKLGFDSHHASEAGCFLGSLVWYTFLFGESPEKLTFVPRQVTPEFAKYLKKVAKSVVK
jgi:hypothetical protein